MDRAHGHHPTIAWIVNSIQGQLDEQAMKDKRPAAAAAVELSLEPGLGLIVGAETPRERQAKRCDNRPRT